MRLMKHYQTLAVLALGAVSALPGLAESYTSASYVQQEHLIAQWDGIDNVGTGRHDPNATVWKDLKGNLDMTLTAKGRWAARGNALYVSGLGAQGASAAPAYKTIEVVYRMAKDGGRLLFVSGIASRFVAFDPVSGIPKRLYFDGAAATRHISWSLDTTALCSAAATYSGNSVSAMYFDGVARDDGAQSNGWGTGDGKVAVGNRKASDTAYNWTGEVYAIRLYDVALTAEEIAANHAIDQARFVPAAQEPLPTAADYVQDGLLVQWDGIDNAGTGVHDPAATTWKNLAGGGYDLTLTNNAAWNAEGRALVVDGISAFNPSAAPEYKTIEVVFKRTNLGGNGRILFNSGIKTRFVLFDGTTSIAAYFSGATLNDASITTKRIYQEFIPSEINFLAARYDDDGIVTDVFKNADARNDGVIANPWYHAPSIYIGGRIMPGKTPEYLWYGEVYAIRLYGTRLTKAQLAHNHRIDCQRFLTSSSYVQEGLASHWDGIDNAGRGLHDSATNTWKNLVPGGQDLTLGTGMWADSALMCFGTKAAATGTVHQTFSSLETVFRNLKYDTSVMLFSAGIGNKFFAFGPSHAQWNSTALATTNFTRYTVGSHTLAGVINSAAYIDGSPAQHEAYENWWDTGTNYVQVGGRVHPTLGVFPFTGDIYAIRVYTNSISASKAAYNAKIDRQRFKLPARTLTWNAKDGDALASGFFCTNGNWRVVEDTRSVPGASDAAVLPAGDYVATLNDEWVLDSLSVGAGATLRIAVPVDGNGADGAVPLTLVNGLAADAAAGLDLDSSAFDREHPRGRVTLIACGVDSSAALQTLADSLNASLRRERAATIEDGTRLVYTAPPPSGVTVIIR